MLNRLPITELVARLQTGEISAREIVQSFLEQIDRIDGRLHAFLHLDRREVLAQADQADRERKRHENGSRPLLGLPIALKDNIAAKDQPLTCASKLLKNFVSPYDATVTRKLRAAGAILFGRLNLDEFAMGSSNENSAFDVTPNPWDLNHVAGGSSGGPAAAVAAGECPGALGSDTGGSIRQPAAYCGCVGLKPSYGRVSRYGLVAFASSLDQIGPIVKTVQDAATLMNVIAGHDPRDSTSVDRPVPDYRAALTGEIRGFKVGIAEEHTAQGLAPETKQGIDQAIKTLASMGVEPVGISLPHSDYAIAAYYLIATAEASANLARFDGIRYGIRVEGENPIDLTRKTRGAGLGSEVKRRIILGTYILSSGYYDAYYLRAQKVRTLIRQDYEKAFETVDAILAPTTPAPAFKIGEKINDPLDMYLTDLYTTSANLVGCCAVSLPCGFSSHPRLPIGFQLLGKAFDEGTILRLAHAYEQAAGWHAHPPPMA